jgi:hypothetical protein
MAKDENILAQKIEAVSNIKAMSIDEMERIKIKKFSPEQIKRAVEKTNKELDRRLNPHKYPPKPRVGECVYCGGTVTESFYRKFKASSGPLIIGPGSRDQHYWASDGLGCIKCGLAYKTLPKKNA